MTHWRWISAGLILLSLVATGALAADEELTEAHAPTSPGTALGAAALNIVYLPIRMPITLMGGLLGGATGFLNGGDRHSAEAVYSLTDGSQVITPEMLEGREPFRFP
jgi:hypothetical protein